jgi:hypothetical protein
MGAISANGCQSCTNLEALIDETEKDGGYTKTRGPSATSEEEPMRPDRARLRSHIGWNGTRWLMNRLDIVEKQKQ